MSEKQETGSVEQSMDSVGSNGQLEVTPTPRSYKVGVKTAGDTDWACNGLRFKTEAEAMVYGKDLYTRWTAVKDFKVLPAEEEPNR